MKIIVVTPKGPYRVSSITLSLVTFLFCCLIVLGGAAFLMGVLFQLLALLSPFLIMSGLAVLKLSMGAFVVYRVTLWLWRLLSRNYGHVSNVLIRFFYFLCMMKKEPQ